MAINSRQLERRRLRYANETAEALERAFGRRAELQLDVIESLWRLASDERVHERVRMSALGLLLVKEEGSGTQVEVNVHTGDEPSPARLQLATRIQLLLAGQAPPAVPAAETTVEAAVEPTPAAIESTPAAAPEYASVIRPVFAAASRPASAVPPAFGLPDDT